MLKARPLAKTVDTTDTMLSNKCRITCVVNSVYTCPTHVLHIKVYGYTCTFFYTFKCIAIGEQSVQQNTYTKLKLNL